MLKNPLLEKLRTEISPEDKARIDESFVIADRIAFLLKKNNLNQKQLAERLNKRESEISKWLSGAHNFTIDTLARISNAIGERVYEIPGVTISETRLQSHILKAIISRIYKAQSSIPTIFESYNDTQVSRLEINAHGVLCHSDKNEAQRFTTANLKPENFAKLDRMFFI